MPEMYERVNNGKSDLFIFGEPWEAERMAVDDIGYPSKGEAFRAWMKKKGYSFWISVKDRLPENDDHVLCCTETKNGRKNIVIGYYMDGMWRCGMNSNVVAWMPLPEPQEEVKA